MKVKCGRIFISDGLVQKCPRPDMLLARIYPDIILPKASLRDSRDPSLACDGIRFAKDTHSGRAGTIAARYLPPDLMHLFLADNHPLFRP